jgi:hypothetical protein
MVIQFNPLQPEVPSVLYKTPLTQMVTNRFAGSELMTLVGIQVSQHHPVHRLQSTFRDKWLKSTARFKVSFLLLVDPAEDSSFLSKCHQLFTSDTLSHSTKSHLLQNVMFRQ